MRKSSNSGEYDSEMVDGKYITSVPILNHDEDNIRPNHRSAASGPASRGLRDLKKPASATASNRANAVLSRTNSREVDSSRRATSGNVFDRLATKNSSTTGSRSNLSGSRRSLSTNIADSAAASSSRGPLSKIKDLTKSMRRSSKEENDTYVAPRNSMSLFSDSRKPMSSLNRNEGSRWSINSSSRSLHKTESNGAGARNASPRVTRKATATIEARKVLPNRALGSTSSLRQSPANSSNNLSNRRATAGHSSKETLSRSSSSTSNR